MPQRTQWNTQAFCLLCDPAASRRPLRETSMDRGGMTPTPPGSMPGGPKEGRSLDLSAFHGPGKVRNEAARFSARTVRASS